MEKLPYGISGFYDPKQGALPSLSLSQYRRWLFPACRMTGYEMSRVIEGQYPRSYHIIDINPEIGNKYSVLCNVHYPFLGFVAFQENHYMPAPFIDLIDLATVLKQYREMTILPAAKLNSTVEEGILIQECPNVRRGLKAFGNIYGRIIFNDFD